MNIKKITKGEIVRVLKTDEQVLVESTTSADRILVLKSKAKASCVVATPEMVEIIKSIARDDPSSKVRLDAAKTIVAYGLGLPDKEQVLPHGNPNQNMRNDEIDAILEGGDDTKDHDA